MQLDFENIVGWKEIFGHTRCYFDAFLFDV